MAFRSWEKFKGTEYTVTVSRDEYCENPRRYDDVWKLYGHRLYGDQHCPGENIFRAMLREYASDIYYVLDDDDAYLDVTYEYTEKALKAVEVKGYKVILLQRYNDGFIVTKDYGITCMLAIAKIDDPDATLENLEVVLEDYRCYYTYQCYCMEVLDSNDKVIHSMRGIFGYSEGKFLQLANELISDLELKSMVNLCIKYT